MTLPQQIEEALDNNRHGWCSYGKAYDLASLVIAMGGGTVVEIGVYSGRSLIPMALACKHVGNGKVIGIDPFEASAAVQDEKDVHAEWWSRIDYPSVEQKLLEAIAENRIGAWCEILKRRSDDVTPIGGISVLHIDGNHSEQAVRDATRFAPTVMIGGFCVLDDVGWDSGCVNESIEILKHLGFVERRRVAGKEEATGFENDYCIMQRIQYCA